MLMRFFQAFFSMLNCVDTDPWHKIYSQSLQSSQKSWSPSSQESPFLHGQRTVFAQYNQLTIDAGCESKIRGCHESGGKIEYYLLFKFQPYPHITTTSKTLLSRTPKRLCRRWGVSSSAAVGVLWTTASRSVFKSNRRSILDLIM